MKKDARCEDTLCSCLYFASNKLNRLINKMADELQQAETVSFVQNRFKEVQDKKKMLELQVLLNTAFLDGNQHVPLVLRVHQLS